MIKNLGESIRARLLNISREKKIPLDFIILRYMQEKLLKRLSLSKYGDNFVLKGGLFFLITDNLNPRVTKDIDFLGISIINTESELKKIFNIIISIEQNDGLLFDNNQIKCEPIKKDADYEGIRIIVKCSLGKIVKKIQVDIGYGDIIYPQVRYNNFPSLLDSSIKNIATYPIESIIAEKFEAMIKLSYLNSRMKDFYDIYNIIKKYNIEGENIKNAINKTMLKRNTFLKSMPDIFETEFYNDADKQIQWNIFISKNKFSNIKFEEVVVLLKDFFGVLITAIKSDMILKTSWNYKQLKWLKI